MRRLLVNIIDKKNNFSELIKFGVVGVINTGVDFIVFTTMTYGLGFQVGISQVLGYTCGVINSFILNKKWTFNNIENSDVKKQMLKFIFINSISVIASTILIDLLVNSFYINALVSKIIVTLLTQFINYFGYKLIVFK